MKHRSDATFQTYHQWFAWMQSRATRRRLAQLLRSASSVARTPPTDRPQQDTPQ